MAGRDTSWELAGWGRAMRRHSDRLQACPTEIRAAMRQHGRDLVARPLADDMRAAVKGPWSRVIRGSIRVTTRASTPMVVVGPGRDRALSSGGRAGDVIPGTEWGGGGGRRGGTATTYRRATPSGATVLVRRRTTRQFARHEHPFMFSTVKGRERDLLDTWADLVDRALTVAGVSD